MDANLHIHSLRPGGLLPKAVFAAFWLALVLGCGALPGLKRRAERLSKPTVLRSADGKSQITLPPGWSEDKELHEQAALQGSWRFKELYVVVITDSREDFEDGMTLERFTETTRDFAGKDAETTEPVETVINGQRALNYEMKATVDGIKIGYVRRNVETPTAFHQIIAWTLRSRFEENKDALLEVVNSFQEAHTTGEASGPPPPAPKKK